MLIDVDIENNDNGGGEDSCFPIRITFRGGEEGGRGWKVLILKLPLGSWGGNHRVMHTVSVLTTSYTTVSPRSNRGKVNFALDENLTREHSKGMCKKYEGQYKLLKNQNPQDKQNPQNFTSPLFSRLKRSVNVLCRCSKPITHKPV